MKNSREAGKTLKRNLEFSIKKPGNTLEKPWNFVLKKVWQPGHMKLCHFIMIHTPYYPIYEKSLLQLCFTHRITPHMKNLSHSYDLRTVLPHTRKIIITLLFYAPSYPTYEKSILQLYFTHRITPYMKLDHFIMNHTPYYPIYEISLGRS